MKRLTITLPEALRKFIESEVARGRYRSASEYVAVLVRRAQKQSARSNGHGKDFKERMKDPRARARVEALLLEGLNSPASEMTRADWDELHRRVWERHAKRSKR